MVTPIPLTRDPTDLALKAAARFQEMAQFLASPHPGELLDENLQIVKKGKFYWCLLSLLQPLYRFFGKDPFSHLRIHRVAEKVLAICKEYRSYFSQEPILIHSIKEELLDKLDKRSHHKHTEQIQKLGQELLSWIEPSTRPVFRKRIWPANLSTIGITLEQKKAIETALSNCDPDLQKDPYRLRLQFHPESGQLQLIKRWGLASHDKLIHSIPLPLPLQILYEEPDQLEKIVLLSKSVSYDLLSGKRSVRKQCVNQFHANLVLHFAKYPCRGIVPMRMEEVNGFMEIWEPPYAKTLDDFLSDPSERTHFRTQCTLIEDLLHGLATLHGIVYRWGEDELSFFHLFHWNLAPSNILLRKGNSNRWEAALTNLGNIAPPLETQDNPPSPKFLSPERMENPLPDSPRLRWLSKVYEGAPSDIWALGIIFAMILSGGKTERVDGFQFPPFPCLTPFFMREKPPDISISSLSQKELNEDIQSLKKESLHTFCGNDIESNQLRKLWDLVLSMLQINLHERTTAYYALDDFLSLFGRPPVILDERVILGSLPSS